MARTCLLPLALAVGCGAAVESPPSATQPAGPDLGTAPPPRPDLGTALPPRPDLGTALASDSTPDTAARVAWPPTKLTLVLLSTLKDPAGQSSRATIRDADSGVIASYRPGDNVREAVRVLAIEDGLVELSTNGEVEYLTISPHPFVLDAKDVFYPDLVDDLGTEMAEGVQMPKGTAYVLKTPANAWGTPRTVALLREAIRSYARTTDGPKVRIGDISLPSGGPFPPHLSHQQGRDVDIGYILRGAQQDALYFVAATATNLDKARTWALIEMLLATDEVGYIFMDYGLQKLLYAYAEANGVAAQRLATLFQYPNGRRASRGKLRHWKGHRGHFHVRFRR